MFNVSIVRIKYARSTIGYSEALVVVVECKLGVVERDEGQGRSSDALPEACSDAAHSPGVLRANNPVECLHRVGATATLSRVATSARPSCLGAGAVARGAGGTDRAKAAEVLSGHFCFSAFAASLPRGGCDRHRRGVTHADRSLHEQGWLGRTTASGIRGNGGAGSTMSRRRPLIEINFGGGFLC